MPRKQQRRQPAPARRNKLNPGTIVAAVPVSTLEIIFKRVPLLADFHPRDFTIRPLSGLTNHNFHLQNNEHDWVLRIPKPETNQYINRQHEAYNARLANNLGIAPDNVWCDKSGLSLSVCLADSRSISTNDMENETTQGKLLMTICRLHKNKKKFFGVADLAELLPRYYKQVPGHFQNQIEPDYRKAIVKLENLPDREKMLVPSHNDLVLENILIDAAGQIWLIDWEYSSMTSPYWDLATLCNAAKLDQTQCTELLTEYGNHHLDLVPEILFDYRFILGVLSTCWMAVFTGNDGKEVN
jgi:thiamine kinase-like enzyme